MLNGITAQSWAIASCRFVAPSRSSSLGVSGSSSSRRAISFAADGPLRENPGVAATPLLPPKIALYGDRRMPYTEKCRRALLLKRLEFELHEPSSAEGIRRWSPETGLLPVMTLDGELISDSGIGRTSAVLWP